ncbi:hypothetical protein QQ045_028022 [Rhodiola kirilowii]
MTIQQITSSEGMTCRSGPIIVETDIASFRDLVQRLTGLPTAANDVSSPVDHLVMSTSSSSSSFPEQKMVVYQPGRRSSTKLKKRSRQQQRVRNPDSLCERRGFQLLTKQPHDDQRVIPSPVERAGVMASDGECEAPELLALFPLTSPSLKV